MHAGTLLPATLAAALRLRRYLYSSSFLPASNFSISTDTRLLTNNPPPPPLLSLSTPPSLSPSSSFPQLPSFLRPVFSCLPYTLLNPYNYKPKNTQNSEVSTPFLPLCYILHTPTNTPQREFQTKSLTPCVSVTEHCEVIRIPECANFTPYDHTAFPNVLGHPTQEIAGQALAHVGQTMSLVCHAYVTSFLCGLFAPECGPGSRPIPPCRSFCQGSLQLVTWGLCGVGGGSDRV